MKNNFKYILGLVTVLFGTRAFAQGKAATESFDILIILILLIIILLAFVIGGLAMAIVKGVESDIKLFRAGKASGMKILLPLMLLLSAVGAQAADVAPEADNGGWLDGMNFLYLLTGFIGFEIVVVLILIRILYKLILSNKYSLLAENIVIQPEQEMNWFDKFNDFIELDKEHTIDLGHEYDGIRELDNKLPGWWLYGFYLTIVFAGAYLYYYHMAAGPSSSMEFENAMKKAEMDKVAYLAKAANSVDENSVKIFKDALALASGKEVFEKNCTPCHGNVGQGAQVGPNLTDDYWIHGGKISDIFKTIKYGYQERGMRSWKDDLSPMQIAQVSSYIKLLKGSNPSGAKEKQGEFYSGDE